ncbi:hypothetical protein UFOVP1456_1, partial [uncultured Caudovirales phage]
SGDRFPQEVGKAFAFVAGGLNALKGALGKAGQRLFVVDLFSAHGWNIDAITYCYKPLFCCYHLFTPPELMLSSIHQQRETEMVNTRKAKQNWEVGGVVKVGFLTLTVIAAIATPGDWLPDAYALTNGKGVFYRFVPHNGLTRCANLAEAMEA